MSDPAQSDSEVLDVRPILSRGEEPFPAIMEALDGVPPGKTLKLLVPFEPVPLYGVLAGKGFQVEREERDGVYEITCHREDGANSGSGSELDLRELTPPQPMEVALESALALGRDETLKVHTRFRPVFLLQRLEEEGFEAESEELGPNHWLTHFWRDLP